MDEKVVALAMLQAAKDSAEWAFWSMVGTWFAGIATFLAVVVSLYIANRRPKPKIRASVSHSVALGAFKRRGIGIEIANIGSVPVKISSLIWHYGGAGTLYHDFDPVSSKLPIKLEHGDSAYFFIHSDDDVRWDRDMMNFITEQGGKAEKLRLAINLGTKDRFFVKPDKSIVKMLKNSI